MAKLFCPYCMKHKKIAILTFSLRYMKNTSWYKPEKSQYCEKCHNYFRKSECESGHYYVRKKGVTL